MQLSVQPDHPFCPLSSLLDTNTLPENLKSLTWNSQIWTFPTSSNVLPFLEKQKQNQFSFKFSKHNSRFFWSAWELDRMAVFFQLKVILSWKHESYFHFFFSCPACGWDSSIPTPVTGIELSQPQAEQLKKGNNFGHGWLTASIARKFLYKYLPKRS